MYSPLEGWGARMQYTQAPALAGRVCRSRWGRRGAASCPCRPPGPAACAAARSRAGCPRAACPWPARAAGCWSRGGSPRWSCSVFAKSEQRARSQTERPRPPAAPPALARPLGRALKGRARAGPAPAGREQRPGRAGQRRSAPLRSGPHLLQRLGHGGGHDGPLPAALLALPVALLVLAVLRLALLRLGHAPAGRKPRLRGPSGAEPGAGRKRAGPGPAPPLGPVPAALGGSGRCPGWPRLERSAGLLPRRSGAQQRLGSVGSSPGSRTLSSGLVLLGGLQEWDTAVQQLKILLCTKAACSTAGVRGTAVKG